jgi:hypothetical protein
MYVTRVFMDVVQKLPVISAKDLMLTLHINPPTSPNVPCPGNIMVSIDRFG